MECPNCKRQYYELPTRCACGYDFGAGEVAAEATLISQSVPWRAEPTTPPVFRIAGRGVRLGAKLVDALAHALPVLMIFGRDPESIIGLFIIAMLAIVAIQWYMLTTMGQTIGKYLLSIRIVKHADGSNGGFVTNVLVREIANSLLGIVPFYVFVDVLFIFRQDHRCIHDHLAGTIVVTAD